MFVYYKIEEMSRICKRSSDASCQVGYSCTNSIENSRKNVIYSTAD